MSLPQTLAVAAALGLSGCASMQPPAGTAEVTGSVIYRERIMLAPPGVVTVTLADTSPMDAPAKVIATQVISDVRAPPINFKLAYDPAKIIPNHTYSVSARIEVDGKLRFITDTHTPVITRGAPTHVEMIAVGVPQT
ncbi:YbaY family lipoprotein [Phenylobacterium sp. Root700]|uniref:YbaY family lipoprotein n=1 Tax=Phenylobacterium sp. Root700 TaxID=1736591 RepID=UPI0009EBDABA|nr:YbaY family lipoprotein [Phenylobacterium sp. Root700]